MYDIVIIGAGIVGSAVAHQLAKYDLKVLVLEKLPEVGDGVTKANSAVIHSGYDPKPGTLKAKLNVRGNQLYPTLCKELNVDFKMIGSWTLAFNQEEVDELHHLLEYAKENGVPVSLHSTKEILAKEPNVHPSVLEGIFAPTAGILAPWDMVYAFLENAVSNGTELKTNQPVIRIDRLENHFRVHTPTDHFDTRYVINAAGLSAETITRMVTTDPGFTTRPTRGEYYVIDRGYDSFCTSVIFPAPSKKGKGVLAIPTIHGNFLLGPTSDLITDKEDTAVTKEGLKYVKDKLSTMMVNIPYQGVIRSFSGIRPKTDRYDFVIEELKDVPNFIQLSGIESPGLASSPGIAEYVETLLLKKENFKRKASYKVYRQHHVRMAEKTPEEANEIIKKNPLYGNIICRCEQITEGEVVDVIKGPLGARTIDGVKRRARPGAGRCQGGFCQPHVLEILARELKISKLEVLIDKPNSNILVAETKSKGGKSHE